MSWLRWARLVSAVTTGAACSALPACSLGRPVAAEGKYAQRASCRYEVQLLGARPAAMSVTARCRGFAHSAFSAAEDAAVPHIHGVQDGAGDRLVQNGGRWELQDESWRSTISYRVDLEPIAREAESFDVALRVGASMVTTASTWLLQPEPHTERVHVTVSVAKPPDVDFVTGLSPAGGSYQLFAHEIHVATYAAFGRIDTFDSSLPGAGPNGAEASRLRVALLDGRLDAPHSDVVAWVRDCARAVARFWNGFPVRNTTVMVIPVAGRSGVVFGKVLPESSPGVVILLGEHTTPSSLFDDWVLVHELFHLGVPSFKGEGKWLDEGLATYYEPLIRARAGWMSEDEVWEQFTRAMPQGLPAVETSGLENAQAYREIYWGGAIVSLLADLAVRRKSDGRVGLEDGLRSVLQAGGDASEVWRLDRVTRLVDRTTKTRTLTTLTRAHARRGTRVRLKDVWQSLGITRRGNSVVLEQGTPKARLRRRLLFGTAEGARAITER